MGQNHNWFVIDVLEIVVHSGLLVGSWLVIGPGYLHNGVLTVFCWVVFQSLAGYGDAYEVQNGLEWN